MAARRRPDRGQIDQGVGVLIQDRIRRVKQVVVRAVGDRRRDVQLAARQIARPGHRPEARPFRRVLRLAGARDVHRHAGHPRDEFIELIFQIAHREVRREAVGQEGATLELEAINGRGAGVVDDRGDANGRQGRDLLGRDLLVLVVRVEGGRGERQAVVERIALQAQLIGGDRLGLVAVDSLGHQGGVAAHVPAARLEAFGDRGVAGQVVGQVVGNADARRELLEGVVGRVVGAGREDRTGRAAGQGRARGAEVEEPLNPGVLLVLGVATADRGVQAVREIVAEVRIGRVALGVDVSGGGDRKTQVSGDGVEHA